jgi:DNA repair protein RecO (recombination protein O)
MTVCKTVAVVIGRRALGESDRLVDFYTFEFGRVTGVAKRARRPRSRFGSSLELFTLGELVFFDSGRSELVRVDHFDTIQPFVTVREDLERLGRGAWVVESLARLSAERDANARLFQLLVRALRGLELSPRPRWVGSCFALRAVDLLGHRPRLDRCTVCARAYPFPDAVLDVVAGGVVCGHCGGAPESLIISGPAMGTLIRLRALRWEAALRLPLAPDLESELGAVVEGLITRLIGHAPRSARFLAQIRRSPGRVAEPPPPGSPR